MSTVPCGSGVPSARARFFSAVLLPIAFFSACVCLPSQAADKDGSFRVKGAGSSTCAYFLDAVTERGKEFVSYGGWLDGYLSAMNRYEAGTYDVVSWQSTELLLASLLRYCQANPETSFHDAAAQLAETLKRTAIRSKDPIVVTEHDGIAAAMYQETLMRVQRRLRQRGFYENDPSGQFDEATRNALLAFQRDKNIDETGLPDQATLTRLLPARPVP
ncbi:MAG: peptidoglycan-binding domain-containing protein [Pseudomonadota bacterium]